MRFLVLVFATLLGACSPSLEGARANYRGPVDVRYDSTGAHSYQSAPRDEAECQRLSTWGKVFEYTAAVLAVGAGASGVTAWPVKSERNEHRLEVAAGALLTGSIISFRLQSITTGDYISKGCGK